MKSITTSSSLHNTFKSKNSIDKSSPDINMNLQIQENIVKPKKKNANKNSESLPDITYDNYINKNITLNDYKLTQLKPVAKSYKLRTSGKKDELIDRIVLHFNKTKSAIHIQSVFRSWICRYIIKLRGPALYDKSICINDMDFCTMEPLNEIDNDYFFSFVDEKQITYGFNVTSLIEMFKRSNNANPYNRQTLSKDVINNIISLYNLSFILCPNFSKQNLPYKIQNAKPINIRRRVSNNIDYSPITRPITSMEDLERYNRIRTIRNNPIDYRLNELFIEIDLLGNYTSREWLDNLELRDYIRLYRKLYEIWYYTSALTREMQNNICPYYSPFEGIFTRPVLHSEIQFDQIKMACVIVMENLVYSGINIDFRKIGTLHALTALTFVSQGARQAMPYLYESIM